MRLNRFLGLFNKASYLQGRITSLVGSLLILMVYELTHNSWWTYTFRAREAVFWSTLQTHLSFEIPLIFICLYLLTFPKAKPKWFACLYPSGVLISIYMIFDHFCQKFSRAPRPSDLENFRLLFDVALPEFLGLIMVGLGVICGFFWFIWSEIKHQPRHGFLRIILLFCLAFLFNSQTFAIWHMNQYQYVSWRELTTIRDNGRFASLFFYGYQESKNTLKLKEFNTHRSQDSSHHQKTSNFYQTLYPGQLMSTPPHIHIIVLESFIDPRQLRVYVDHHLQKPTFSISPLATEMLPHLSHQESGFSDVFSPVYGGGTAQAEFELLTGLPALARVNSIEFNVMRGAPMPSFIRQLKHHGYQTLATVGTNMSYFNVAQAYQSIGLDRVVYLENEPTYQRRKGDQYIFDGDLFDYHLKRLRSWYETHQKDSYDSSSPRLISYLVGMYGHTPFERNEDARPHYVKVEPQLKTLDQITHQFYYRTRALGRYISALEKLDPNALIYVTSDHLPAILNDELQYAYQDRHQNIALLKWRGKVIDVKGRYFYQLPQFIWHLISKSDPQNKSQNVFSKKFIETMYYQTLSQSIEIH